MNILSFHIFLDSDNVAPAIVVDGAMVRRFLAGAQFLRGPVRGEKCGIEVQQPCRSVRHGIVRETPFDQLNQV